MMKKLTLLLTLLFIGAWLAYPTSRNRISRVIPTGVESYQVEEELQSLDSAQVHTLKTLFEKEESYLHGLTKPCLFAPEYLIEIGNETILYSPACKQIKKDGKIRDIDPIANDLDQLIP